MVKILTHHERDENRVTQRERERERKMFISICNALTVYGHVLLKQQPVNDLSRLQKSLTSTDALLFDSVVYKFTIKLEINPAIQVVLLCNHDSTNK